jgi:DNA-binding transcriptional MerR regulator
MTEIPEKLYFQIGEVSEITRVEPHVLRYWQQEFRQLNPKTTLAGRRRYTRKDIELILRIAHLRYQEKYSIESIKRLLGHASSADSGRRESLQRRETLMNQLSLIRLELQEIVRLLDGE